jgi:hypothetical protein
LAAPRPSIGSGPKKSKAASSNMAA